MTDALVILIGIILAGGAWRVDHHLAAAIVYVVGHFFLFCNVIRMARPLELIWAVVFLTLCAVAVGFAWISWPLVFLISGGVTIIVTIIQTRAPSYHGVGWKLINPALPDWWSKQAG